VYHLLAGLGVEIFAECFGHVDGRLVGCLFGLGNWMRRLVVGCVSIVC
jgi:hypothetical protein